MSDIKETVDVLDLEDSLEKNTKVLKSASSNKSVATQLIVSNQDTDRVEIPYTTTGMITEVFSLPENSTEVSEMSYDSYYTSNSSATSEKTNSSAIRTYKVWVPMWNAMVSRENISLHFDIPFDGEELKVGDVVEVKRDASDSFRNLRINKKIRSHFSGYNANPATKSPNSPLKGNFINQSGQPVESLTDEESQDGWLQMKSGVSWEPLSEEVKREAYEIAEETGYGIVVTSGHRTPQQNANTRGSAKNSEHMFGRALDFRFGINGERWVPTNTNDPAIRKKVEAAARRRGWRVHPNPDHGTSAHWHFEDKSAKMNDIAIRQFLEYALVNSRNSKFDISYLNSNQVRQLGNFAQSDSSFKGTYRIDGTSKTLVFEEDTQDS